MRRRSRVSVALLGVLVLLAIGECIVRAVRSPNFLHPVARNRSDPWRTDVHQRSSTPGLDYELRPGAISTQRGVEIAVNSAGLRGPDIRDPRAPGSFRLLVLGDSVSFGLGVQERDTWPRVLESRLRVARPELDVEVLNHSVSGYGTLDEALVLEARIDVLQPDLVVLGYCLNDPEQAPIQGLRAYFHEAAVWQHSALARLVASTLRERAIARSGDTIRWLHEPRGDSWTVVRESLMRIERTASVRGVPVLVAVFPMFGPHDRWADYPWSDVNAFVAAESHSVGFGTIDILSAYAGSGLTSAELRVDESPASAEGHALAAGAIAALLLAEPARWLARRP